MGIRERPYVNLFLIKIILISVTQVDLAGKQKFLGSAYIFPNAEFSASVLMQYTSSTQKTNRLIHFTCSLSSESTVQFGLSDC